MIYIYINFNIDIIIYLNIEHIFHKNLFIPILFCNLLISLILFSIKSFNVFAIELSVISVVL